MKNNKIMKTFLMLIAAVTITVGMSGCGKSSLSDSRVIEKIKELAQDDREQMGYCVEIRSVNSHIGSGAIWYYNLFASGNKKMPDCDELWVAEFHSDKWNHCIVRLCRRGSYYFLHFNPQDK